MSAHNQIELSVTLNGSSHSDDDTFYPETLYNMKSNALLVLTKSFLTIISWTCKFQFQNLVLEKHMDLLFGKVRGSKLKTWKFVRLENKFSLPQDAE